MHLDDLTRATMRTATRYDTVVDLPIRAVRLSRERWSTVLIDHVTDRPDPVSPASIRIEALVDLGELTPADVRIDVLPTLADVDLASPKATKAWSYRMCSVQSFRNGRFLFEASVPQGLIERAPAYTIRILPAGAYGDVPDAPPITHSVSRHADA